MAGVFKILQGCAAECLSITCTTPGVTVTIGVGPNRPSKFSSENNHFKGVQACPTPKPDLMDGKYLQVPCRALLEDPWAEGSFGSKN